MDVSLSQAADSIGLKEIPAYEVKMGKQCDWIRKTQVDFFDYWWLIVDVTLFFFSFC